MAVGWLYRLLELALVVVGLGWLIVPVEGTGADAASLGLWLVLATIYLVLRWRALRPGRRPPADWRRQTPGRRLGSVLTVVASLVGIVASGNLVVADRSQEVQVLLSWLWAPAVVYSWLLLHLGYAASYARWYYEREPGGLRFPATEEPGMVDFTYFALTLGTSFAVSDVEVRSSAMRYRVLLHSVLAFFFNAAVLAIAIGAVLQH